MTTKVFVWDTYPSDEVTEAELEMPEGNFSPHTRLRLLDLLYALKIGCDDSRDQESHLDGGVGGPYPGALVHVIRGRFGRLGYSLYWCHDEPLAAKSLAERELEAHISGQTLPCQNPI